MPECAVCGTEFEHPARQGRVPKTCSPGCARTRKTRQTEESRTRTAARVCPDDKHGTATGYSNYRCGCTECSKWARKYKAERRATGLKN
jgi:hypothetical protein